MRSHTASARYLAPSLVRREQGRRRIVLLGIAAMILLSTSPVFGHHLASQAEVLLAGYDHLFNICLIALHALLAPVHGIFHILLIAGLTFAVGSRLRAVVRSRRTLGALDTHQPSGVQDPIVQAAHRAAVPLRSLRVVAGLPMPAFTAGWIRPRIYVAAELPQRLTDDELVCVLAHEGAHAVRRDPLRLSLLRFLGNTLFYLPALRRLAEDMADEAEIKADDIAAAQSEHGATVLASAIVKLATWPGAGLPFKDATSVGAIGFHRPDLVERRVRRLIGEDTPVGTHVTVRSLGGAIVTLVLVMLSGLIMAHPLAAGGVPPAAQELGSGSEHTQPGHCRHRGGLAITHIFCLGFSKPVDSAHCPHTGQ